ncbi:MAG: O-methyltransferase [Phycisphaeraceae bacterium]
MPKYVPLNDDLAAYVDAHRHDAGDPLLRELAERTAAETGNAARMQIPGDQGAWLTATVAAMNAQLAVEIGTFTGHSSICIARGLSGSGTLHCFDRSESYTAIARAFWSRAGVDDRITLHLGDALEKLAELPDQPIDFAFIDADKTGYARYYDALLPRLRPGGLIAFDNMLWGGDVINTADTSDDTAAIGALNDQLTADDRVDNVLLTIGDGVHLCRKR